ncbi:TPA: hypothetical protein KSL57_001750 [Clostridioides difficile]|nr:hypothetical protein [Clostridioides difficile]
MKKDKAIIQIDKVKNPDVLTGKYVVPSEDTNPINLENGAVINIGELEDMEYGRDTHKIYKVTNDTLDWGIVDDPATMYDERLDERDYEVSPGQICRCRRLKKGDEVTISLLHIADKSIAVKDKLQLKSDSFQFEKLPTADAKTPVAEVLELWNYEGQDSVTIKVL